MSPLPFRDEFDPKEVTSLRVSLPFTCGQFHLNSSSLVVVTEAFVQLGGNSIASQEVPYFVNKTPPGAVSFNQFSKLLVVIPLVQKHATNTRLLHP